MDTDEVQASDVYIAVVGMTGSGKSYFTTQCTGEPSIHIGHGLESFTKRTTVHTMERSGRTVHLVDAPGFGDTYRSDEDVFLEIAYTLIKAYEFGIRISGIVLLQPITDVRVTGSIRRSLEMLKGLCGPEAYESVVLVANRCGEVSEHQKSERLIELRAKPHFWKDLCESGSEVLEIAGGRDDCLSVLDHIINRDETYSLRFQQQVVEQKMKINETDAGKAVFSATSATEFNLREELAELRKELKSTTQQSLVQTLDENIQQTKSKLDLQIAEIASLNTTSDALISTWDNKYQEEQQQMTERIEELEDTIQKLNQRLAESPPSYEETIRRIQQAQQERFEVASVQSLQLSRKNLTAARGSHTAGWIGAAAGLGSLAIAAAPLAAMCVIM